VQFYNAKDEIYVDPTGRLIIHTEWGGDYHVVFCHYDGNYIHVDFAKDRTKKTLAEVRRGLEYFSDRNIESSYAMLDNEFAAAGFKRFFRQKGLHI
jgi:hypothetical protein